MDNKRPFLFSNTARKQFREKGICLLNWKAKWITREIPRDPSGEQQLKGIYFETLALGAHSGGEDLPDVSFMMLKDGSPNAELKRIIDQSNRFKELFDPSHKDFLGFEINSTQELLQCDLSKRKGYLDFACTDPFGETCVFDLKFTADVEASFGDYSWGRDTSDIDWEQQVLYQELYELKYGVRPKMYVLVFDASPRKGIKLFDLSISSAKTEHVRDLYSQAWDEVNEYEEKGWPTSPSEKKCSTCPLECIMRFVKPEVVTKRVFL